MTVIVDDTARDESVSQTREVLNEEDKSFDVRQREAQKQRKRKKKKSDKTLVASSFPDLYKLTGETLGEGRNPPPSDWMLSKSWPTPG